MTVDVVRQVAGAGCFLAVVALSGCSGHPAHPAAKPTVTVKATASPTHASWSDPVKALKDGSTKVLVSTGRRTGGLTLMTPKTAPGAVLIATECRGTGTLTVNTGRYGVYDVPCGAAPDGTLNEYDSPRATSAVPLKISATPDITWSVAVGWSVPGGHVNE